MSRIEQHIVAAWARRLADKVVEQVIDGLEGMEAVLSGDSGLQNVWEEVCAQVQDEESVDWATYDDLIQDLLYSAVKELDRDAQLALWAVTDAGWDYIYDHHADQDGAAGVPLNTGEIVCELRKELLSAAADYESPSLYRYIWGADNPEYGDEDDDIEEVWFPISPGLTETQRAALMVEYRGDRQKMDSMLFKDLLQKRIKREVMADPLEARSALEMSSESAPELWQIAHYNPAKDWPSAIVNSDGMAKLLALIDWDKEKGGALTRRPEPVSLREVLEQIA